MDKLLPPPPLASDERFSILANIAAERFAQLDLTALMVYLVDLVDAFGITSPCRTISRSGAGRLVIYHR